LDLAKKEAEKPKRELTKRQLSRWQRQKRRQRIILGSGILVVVAVLAVLGAGVYTGWYVPEYKPLHQTVIKVNDTEFDMDYYIKTLVCYCNLQGLSTEYAQYMTDWVVTAIERNELVKQGAAELDFKVSDEEVSEELKSYNPPLSKDYSDVVRAQMLVDKLNAEYFDKQVPTSAEQRHVMAMFLESESQANEVRASLEAGEDFATLAGVLSLDSTSKEKNGDLDWHPEGVLTLTYGTSLLDDYAFGAEAGALSQPIYDETKTKAVGYWLIKVVERDDEAKTAKVKVMLLGSEQEANEVRAKLEAGDDFATLAGEFSQHDESKGNGGDFEVTSPDAVSSVFSEFVFSAELNVLSQPIRDDTVSTEGGYWLVKVVDIDNNRQITDEDRGSLKADALNKWVEGLFDNPENKVESYLDDEKKAWAIQHVIGG
jgi:parvulin-like peptidyl-prolyl isomerase